MNSFFGCVSSASSDVTWTDSLRVHFVMKKVLDFDAYYEQYEQVWTSNKQVVNSMNSIKNSMNK